MSLSRTAFLLLYLLTLWVGGALCAQSTQLFFKQFTTDDGLPSSETYVSLVDRNGLLWVGTDNGVASFDGYEFTVYDADDGLTDAVVFTLQEDAAGRIWAGTASGRVFYFENGTFNPFSRNDELYELRKDNSLIHLLDVLSTGELVLKVNKKGILKIRDQGPIQWLTNDERPTVYVYVPESNQDLITKQRRYHINLTNKEDRPYRIVRWNGSGWDYLGETSLPRGYLRMVFPFILDLTHKNRGVFLFGTKNIYSISPGRKEVVFENNNYFLSSVLPLNDGSVLAFMGNGGGVQRLYFDYENSTIRKEVYLKDISFSAGYTDKWGGIWVNSLDAGVYYLPYPEEFVYTASNEKNGQRAIAVAAVNENEFYASYSNGAILYRNTLTDKYLDIYDKVKSQDLKNLDLSYDESEDMILMSGFYGQHHDIISDDFKNNDLHKYKFEEKVINQALIIAKIYKCGIQYCWSNSHGFGIFDLKSKKANSIENTPRSLPMYRGIESFFIDSKKRNWVGTIYGLQQYDSDKGLFLNNLGFPALSERVVKIVEPEPEVLMFATRGEGVVYHSSDTTFQIGVKDGLASNSIRDLETDQSGAVWVATLEGLSKIVIGSVGDSVIVRTFTQTNGLVDQEVFDVDIINGNIWLATARGVVRFREPSIDTVIQKPRITRIGVNGKNVQIRDGMVLQPDEEDITISYVLTDFRFFDKVSYRYRINELEEWRATNERTVVFSNLGFGDYNFSVQSQNREGVWSESSSVSFSIAKPWYLTWWAIIMGFLSLVGTISMYFLYRERNRRREQNLLLQITRLEHEALHAQMNPHFVFNALNSIQNFVLKSDPKQAAIYLSRFALVIRQTLRSSVKGHHTLANEVSMLETYLILEKLRFKEGFNYQVTVAPDLDQQAIVLPPLLIQPFVENAIIHGLAEKVKEGMITISFQGDKHLLKVAIEDNGRGFMPDEQPDKESMGMDITRRRLEMMKGENRKVSGMKVEPLYNAKGKLRGTRVVLWIYLQNAMTTPTVSK